MPQCSRIAETSRDAARDAATAKSAGTMWYRGGEDSHGSTPNHRKTIGKTPNGWFISWKIPFKWRVDGCKWTCGRWEFQGPKMEVLEHMRLYSGGIFPIFPGKHTKNYLKISMSLKERIYSTRCFVADHAMRLTEKGE